MIRNVAGMKQDGWLSPLSDVARIRVRAGQVLVYPRHTPPGVFVVLTGTLYRFADGTLPGACRGERRDASSGVFATPAPAEMCEPACAGLAVETEADLLFVPRSVVLARDDVDTILAAAGVAVVPLGERSKDGGDAVNSGRAR